MKYSYLILLGILMIAIYVLSFRYDSLSDKYDKACNNLIAVRDSNIAFSYGIKDLQLYNLRVFEMYDSLKKDIKIKDQKVKEIIYNKTYINIKDSIRFKDSVIFVLDLRIDTTLTKEGHTLNLALEYPNKIDYAVRIFNERAVVVHEKKEYVNKKKVFPLNLFLKKVKVLKVEVIDSNKAIENVETKVIYTD